ncbi:MAG TPA: tetratricopeptide repeat protein [Pyrinomonadaceae bacterium]|jgi:tetratricopeptide (TPR) repeat protein
MNNKKQWRKIALTIFVLWTLALQSIPARAQEIVGSEDISGGSSVFVFRQGKKTPQTKSAFRNSSIKRNAVARNDSRRKVKAQIVAVNKNKPQRTKVKVDPNTVAKTTQQAKTAAQKEKASTVLTGAAETYLERKQTDLAIQYFRDAIALNPKNENARLGLSEALTAKGDETADRLSPQSAIVFYEEAVKLNDKNSAAFASLGEIYDDLNQNEKAIANYEKALQLSPELSELHAPLGILYLQKGEVALAENYLTKATASNGANDPETQYFKGLLYYKQNKNQEALAAFSSAIKAKPDYAEAYYYQGETYDRLDKDKEAIAAYKEAVRINPKFTEAWFDLGVAYYNRNRYEDAITAYKESLKLKSDNGEAHLNLANAFRQLDRYAEANVEYAAAAQHIKGDADMYSEWGFCLGKERKWNNAVARLDTAVAMRPDPVDYTNLGWAYYNAAQDDLRAKREPEAKAKLGKGRDALQKATVLNPKFDAAFLNLGITLTDLGDYNGAVQALTRATDLRKNWVSAINELGLAYRQLKDFDNAVKQFKKATEIDKKFAPGFYNLGESEYRRGNMKEAKKAQEKLKKLHPNLATQLDIVISGAVLTETKNQIQNRIPKPKLPF